MMMVLSIGASPRESVQFDRKKPVSHKVNITYGPSSVQMAIIKLHDDLLWINVHWSR